VLGSALQLQIIGVGEAPRLIAASGCSGARARGACGAELSTGPAGLEGRSGSKAVAIPAVPGEALEPSGIR